MKHGERLQITGRRMNRRNLIQAAGGAALGSVLPLPLSASNAQESTPSAAATTGASGLRTYPEHGSVAAAPGTEISFRGALIEHLGQVRVSGTESGGHSGVMMPHRDGLGVSYVPDRPFGAGEQVVVTADIPLTNTISGALAFTVSVPVLPSPPPAEREEDSPLVEPHQFRTLPDLRPPVVNVLVDNGESAPGFVFLAPRMENGQSGSLIIDNSGEPVWFYTPEPDLSESMDFRVCQYRGEPVLTWWEGAKPTGYGVGHYVIANAAYEQVAVVQVPNGFQGGDHHEFHITPRDTALFGIYEPVLWDLSPYGGAAEARIIDQVVLEVEIETGRVLFEWHALDHIDIVESVERLPENGLYDYVHMNSIGEDADGNIILSLRHTHSIVLIDRGTNQIRWRLNGERSDFEMGEGAAFVKQHDARALGNGIVTLLDNGTASADSGIVSRGLVLQLDEDAMTATVVAEYPHPTQGTAQNQSNMQTLPNGNLFTGWGPTPDAAEFTPDGELVWHAQLPEGGQSYRAYRFEWHGMPASLPDLAVTQGSVFVSWNGATGVAEWRLVAGEVEDAMQAVTTVPRDGFETEITAVEPAPFLAVEALDAAGRVLARSRIVQGPVA